LHVSTQKPALAGLHDIDWRNLQHAYGSADDVPDQLLSLAAGDDSVLGDLFGNIYHQGSVYQATAYAVPFLWRLLAAQGEVGHSGIAALLGAIAEASGDQRSGWTQETREEVWNGAAVALQLLASSNATARRGAASILACFAEKADQLATPLRGVLRRADCSLHERARVGLALAALGNYDEEAFGPDDLGFFAEAMHLAQGAAAGDTEAVHTCLSILIETIESDPADLSDWTG
jgi:hypothetical protein